MVFVIIGIILICIIYGIYIIRKQQLQSRQRNLNNYEAQVKILELQIKDCEKTIQNYNSQIEKIGAQADKALENLSNLSQQITLKQKQFDEQSNNLWKIKKENDIVQQQHQKRVYLLGCNFDEYKKSYDNEKQKLENQLTKLSNTLAAAAQANLREQEKKDNLSFYMINLNQEDLDDIEELNKLKVHFHHPEAISKLIWTQYIQKRTGQMCARVFGANALCGVYKITNVQTQQYYIGQSVNIAQRMKEHIKHGLGIDYNGNNKLYRAMGQHGVWNFTFELMERCQRAQLNEVEAKWIELYQADTLGYNSTQGNNKGK